MVFVIAFIFRVKQVLNINSEALFLNCLSQVLLGVVQGLIRVYFYYHHGCLPLAGSPLCESTVYLDYIPTQINNFLVTQLSFERLLLVVKPFIFHRRRHQNYSMGICIHYIDLFLSIIFPCLYYPIIMQNGAPTIDPDDPSSTQTCDLWYGRDIYKTFDLLLTFIPYFLILMIYFCVIEIFFYRRYVYGQQVRRAGTRNKRRILFSLHIFLIWFVLAWPPSVLYDSFQTILNLRYSISIDAIITFVVYFNYPFSSSIVLITIKELHNFWLEKIGLRHNNPAFHQRVHPIRSVRPTQPVRYITERHQIAIISIYK